MKKYILPISILILIIIVAAIAMYCICYSVYSIESLPIGEYIDEYTSPDKSHTLKAYLCTTSLSSDSIRCEIIDNRNNSKRNIYWNYKESNIEATWLDDSNVIINGTVLNIYSDTYDWRK